MRPQFGILDLELLLSQRKRTYQPASLLKRFLNLLIDYLTILHFSIIIGFFLGSTFTVFGKSEWMDIFKNTSFNLLMSWAVIYIYYVVCEYFLEGKTLGKYATKTSVKNISGKPATLIDILIRTGYRLIPLEPVSIFFGKKRSWHDSFSNTMVVED